MLREGSPDTALSPVHQRPAQPNVEFRQLRYFVCVAQELHFGRAAARLSMTQPGLSRSIAKLERALDVQLLQRSRRGVRLTDAGVEFLHSARHLLADLDSTLQRARSAHLRVGSSPSSPATGPGS